MKHLFCAATIMINLSHVPWNKHDKSVLDRNTTFCAQHYEFSVCVKKFIKLRENGYHIWCGK
jgi:hypothetical protein